MAMSSLQQVPSSQYLAVIERVEEMARLQAQAQKRKSMLIFGPETVGKTRLLDDFVKAQKYALYVHRIQSLRDLVLDLIERLRRLHLRDVRLPANPKSLSTSSLKGIVQKALDQGPFMLVLDHLAGPQLHALAVQLLRRDGHQVGLGVLPRFAGHALADD